MADELYAHQKKFLAKNPDRRLLCWDTGTGKTRAAIEWGNLGRAEELIIVPKALRENWLRNCAQHSDVNYHVITKEEFRRDWDKLPYRPQLIVDEGHYFAGDKSQLTKALQAYIKKWEIVRILILTATPYLSSPWNIFTLAKHLRVHWSYIKFLNHFFEDRYVGRRQIAGKTVGRAVKVVKPGMEADIAKCVAKIGDVVRIDECADIPEQVFETEYFEMNVSQRNAMREVYDPNPIVRYTKYHQIEGGTLKSEGYGTHKYLETAQLDRLRLLIVEHPKLIVVCRYNLEIEHIPRALNLPREHVYIINGMVKNRDEIVQKVEAAERAVVFINAACSEGYELPSVPLMVFWSLSFSYKDYKQMLGRILRLNKLKKNLYLHLLTHGVSEGVYRSIMSKQDFDIEIYARDQAEGKGLPDALQ